MTPHDVILFDGHCNLCSSSVQFILARDSRAHFRFLSLQDEKAADLFNSRGVRKPDTDSVVLITGSKVYTRSSAALRIAAKLRGAWPLLQVFYIIPPFLRDGVYDWIGRHRYQWFGQHDTCWLPSPEWKQRFL